MTILILQISTMNDSLTNNPEITEETLSVIDLITSGGVGGNFVMGTLATLSILAIYIVIERYSNISKASKNDPDFLQKIQDFLEKDDAKSAKDLCRITNSPISRMIEKGVDRIKKPMTDVSAAIDNQGKLEIYKMENNLANLATISGAAPMIGFLGTVIGMIVAFHEMANAGFVFPEDHPALKLSNDLGQTVAAVMAEQGYMFTESNECIIFANVSGWTIAHTMAVNGYQFPEDSNVLKLANDSGWTVAHEMARGGHNFASDDILDLKDNHGVTVASLM